MDRKFILISFFFAILGLCLGIFMAATKNHGQFVTHAHILLIGFLLSFVYGLCHKLWLGNLTTRLANTQFYIHLLGVLIITVGLFLFYGNFVPLEKIDPVLAFGSISVLVAAVLMFVMFIKSCKST